MSEIYKDLPDDVRELIESPLVPFEELVPYDYEDGVGLYELDGRVGEQGKYHVELLMKMVGKEALLFTRVETTGGNPLFAKKTAPDKATDTLHHIFPEAPAEEVNTLFPKAA